MLPSHLPSKKMQSINQLQLIWPSVVPCSWSTSWFNEVKKARSVMRGSSTGPNNHVAQSVFPGNWKSQVRVPVKIRMRRKLPEVKKSEKVSDKRIISRSQQSCDTDRVRCTNQYRIRRKDEGQNLPDGMTNGKPHSSASTKSKSTASHK